MKANFFSFSRRSFVSQLGVALLLTFSVASAGAAPLKIATIDVAPFGFLGADGKPTGIWWEIGNLISKEAGIPSENALVPYARTVKDMEEGTSDLVMRLSNEQLEKCSVQVGAIGSMPTIILGPSGTTIKDLSELHGKTVGILRGAKYDEKFTADALIKKFEVNDYAQALKMLASGRLDGAAGTTIGLYYAAKQQGLKPSQLGSPFILGNLKPVMNFSKKTADEKTIAAFKAAAEKLEKEGAFIKITDKYMGDFKWSSTDVK